MKIQSKGFFAATLALAASLILTSCGFGKQTVAATILPSCSLDSISGAVQDAMGNYSTSVSTPDLILRGWVANGLAGESPDEVTLVFADSLGKIVSHASGPGLSRPDVANVYQKSGMDNSGFEILMENVSEPGTYLITMQGKFKNDNLVCSKAYNLTASN